MATLATLIKQELVLPWHVELDAHQQPQRVLLLLPQLAARLDQSLAAAGSTWNIEETPAQQLDSLTAIFVAGEPLAHGRQFKCLVPDRSGVDGVWYFKTADVRLFGWFPFRDYFVATSVGIADVAKRLQLYRPFGQEVARCRGQLDLDEPKYIGGIDPNGVVSNFTQPD
jgi:hypothetical protein